MFCFERHSLGRSEPRPTRYFYRGDDALPACLAGCSRQHCTCVDFAPANESKTGLRQCKMNNETAVKKPLPNATTHWTAFVPNAEP